MCCIHHCRKNQGVGTPRKISKALGNVSAHILSAGQLECVSDKDLNGKLYTRQEPADLFSARANKSNLPRK